MALSGKLAKKFSTSQKSHLRRVVITGMGMVSPLGSDLNQSWESLLSGKSGIKNLKSLPAYMNDSSFPECAIAPIHESFDAKKWQVPYVNNSTNNFAMAAAAEALADANWFPQEKHQLERTGVNIGILSSNISNIAKSLIKVGEKGSYDQLNRLTMLQVLNNMTTANISIKYKFQGPNGTTASACATSAASIVEGAKCIQLSEADVMVVGGSEEVMNPTIIHACIKMGAMCNKKFEDPTHSSRPFDSSRSGFILGEGSGILVLEEFEHAKKRGAKIYAEIGGYGNTSDGFHLTRPQDDGDGAYRAMKNALNFAGVQQAVSSVDFVNVHATSTPAGDLCEAKAIYKLLQDDKEALKNCVITANKSAIGHTFGAAGSIESIFTIKSLHHGEIPAILNLTNPEPEPALNYASSLVKRSKLKYALKNSFGFGGANVSILFQKE